MCVFPNLIVWVWVADFPGIDNVNAGESLDGSLLSHGLHVHLKQNMKNMSNKGRLIQKISY